ncbi:hypothetical protein BSKO_13655 [Bryopsis sp. KO-2023]|nr:hypothetical protein BSKO_13655 [Bryopsis sp. KO-2023]
MDYSPHSEERGKEKEGAEAVCCGEYPDQLYWENVQGNLDQTCTRREGAAEELAALLERLSVANRDPKDAPETTEVDLLCYSEDEDRQDENGSMGKRNTNGVAAGGRFVDKDISTPQGGVKRLRERGQLAEAKIDDTQPKEDADHRAPDESSQLSPA